MIEKSETKNIEIAIDAFRTIKKAVQEYGFLPRSFITTPLDDEDMNNPALKQRLRNVFDEYAGIYYAIYNQVLPTLTKSMRNIESEYNYMTINSRNLKKALELFTSKITENLFDFESVCKKSRYIMLFIAPLRKNAIISAEEADMYCQIMDNVGYNYCQSAMHMREVFNMKQPWSTQDWDEEREKLESTIIMKDDSRIENVDNHTNNSTNFQGMKSFDLIEGKDIPFDKVYKFLIDSKSIINVDKEYFINCVTHAYFNKLYETGKHINILYVIRILEDYYGKEWRNTVCKSIGIETKRVTQDAPKSGFSSTFYEILKSKKLEK